MNIKLNRQWVYVDADEVPPCDFCNMPAHVNAVTSVAGHAWADMCFKHWELQGYYKKLGKLGKLLIARGAEMENYSSADIEHLRNIAERNDQPMYKVASH